MPKIDVRIGVGTPALTGLCGFIGWERLAQWFRDGGELKSNETVAAFRIDERGITYTINYQQGQKA